MALAAGLMLALAFPSGCATAPAPSRPLPTLQVQRLETKVGSVLARQVAAWNAGDIPAFMEGYARSADTRFASGASVTRGWDTVLKRYQSRYGDRKAMGHLDFTELEFSVLSPDAVMVFGHWRLTRDADRPGGLFTLLFRRSESGWRIVHDHTSAESPN